MARPGLDRRHAGLAALAAAFWPSLARANLGVQAAGSPALADHTPPLASTEIGVFTDLYRRMTAPVRINGQGPFDFVVDTGANRSVISSELAGQLGLMLGPPQPVNDAAGVSPAPTVRVKLAVGARVDAALVLSVMPASAIGGVGMLGLDRLADQRLTLDFRNRRLDIEGGRGVPAAGDVVVRARRRFGQLTLVDADLAGAPIAALLDSGSQGSVGNLALQTLAQEQEPKGIWSTAAIQSAMGQTIPAEVASLPSLRIGGLLLQNLSVAFADLHTFRLWGLGNQPALLLGVDVLSKFDSVELDFETGHVCFRLPASA